MAAEMAAIIVDGQPYYCLSVNYNNSSPAVGNDSQNGIHYCRWAPIIY